MISTTITGCIGCRERCRGYHLNAKYFGRSSTTASSKSVPESCA